MEDPDVAEIARRYLVMNVFDGVLMMGGVTGAYFAVEMESRIIISAGLGRLHRVGVREVEG